MRTLVALIRATGARLCPLLVLLAMAMTLRAQPTPVSLDFEFSVMATERLSDIAFVSLKPEARGKARLTAADFDIRPLRVNSQGRSDLYHYRGPAPLRFVRTRRGSDRPAVEQVLATVNAPVGDGRRLFVLYSIAHDTMKVIALPDGPEAFPRRHARLLNLTGEPVALSLGGRSLHLDRDPQSLPPQPVDARTRLGVAMNRQGRPVPVFDQSLEVGEDERLLIVLLPPFRVGADVRTRVIRDTLAAPPSAIP